MDGSRPGAFYVNLANPSDTFSFGMRTVVAHEALPGHHFQISLAREMKGLPMFRRLVPFSAFGEGWGLYAEQLADEGGFYDEPFSRLGYLMGQLWRASRLVVDTGIHLKRWPRQQAIQYMLDHTGRPRNDAIAEVDRYTVLPGQATAYKVGQLFILSLRDRAKKKLGKAFDLKRFHQAIVAQGALPLNLLSGEIDRWIEREAQ